MSKTTDRRGFLRGTLMTGAVAAGFVGLEEHILMDAMAKGIERSEKKRLSLPGPMPMGKLGDLNISRVISGGNLIGGWAHARDLLYVSELMQAYNTEERRFDTFELLEEGGVNTVQVDMTQIEQVNKYKRERGGKLQIITSVRPLWGLWNRPEWDEIKSSIDRVIDQGVVAIYVHGGYADQLVESALKNESRENLEYIGKVLEYIREKGYPAGVGSHALEVPKECDKEGLSPDFYFKTFHHDRYWSAHPRENRRPFTVDRERSDDHNLTHDNIFDLDPAATAAYMKEKKQPWFAFKIFAAGAIPPEDGLRFAFEKGADFAVIGMFDFQVEEDLRIAINTLNNMADRERPWMA